MNKKSQNQEVRPRAKLDIKVMNPDGSVREEIQGAFEEEITKDSRWLSIPSLREWLEKKVAEMESGKET